VILRRAITILQLLGFTACQLLAAPHVHDEDPLHEHHAAAPHVHLSWLFGRPVHCHPHHAALYRHASSPQANDWQDDDHDADAFYLPAASASPTTEHVELAPATAWDSASALTSGHVAHDLISRALALNIDRPPSASSVWHCALILQLRTLRI
jgi:hypothetical protein